MFVNATLSAKTTTEPITTPFPTTSCQFNSDHDCVIAGFPDLSLFQCINCLKCPGDGDFTCCAPSSVFTPGEVSIFILSRILESCEYKWIL